MSGASYTDEILISPLEENLADDPYGTAVYVIRNTITRAVALSGAMSDDEFKNLVTFEELLRTLDNA